ncbi:hypothetical protein E4U53_001737 [Claviceps sorghi]|nr:hypothetical protein E4U53_001737 [Claviceps sorghi]
MYPPWPQSAADLVPLPHCDGPKLKPFPFKGPQNIKFLDFLGEGLHGCVFKVMISGQIYALKLFKFSAFDTWMSDVKCSESDLVQAKTIAAQYAEPFNCECRAYGRLQETGYEDLAIKSFGYLLLDEEHERILMDQFSHKHLEFDESDPIFFPENRRPPLRGIVKEFGYSDKQRKFRTKDARMILGNVYQFHQLGIIRLDLSLPQFINGKLADFTAKMSKALSISVRRSSRKSLHKLGNGVYGIRFTEPDRPITIVTGPKVDVTSYVNNYPSTALELPFPVKAAFLASLTELDRTQWNVNPVSYQAPSSSTGTCSTAFSEIDIK